MLEFVNNVWLIEHRFTSLVENTMLPASLDWWKHKTSIRHHCLLIIMAIVVRRSRMGELPIELLTLMSPKSANVHCRLGALPPF